MHYLVLINHMTNQYNPKLMSATTIGTLRNVNILDRDLIY